MRINPVLTRLGDYPIAAVHEKVAELRGRGRRVIDFSIGDPREPTPPFIRQALVDAVPVSSQYPLTAGIIELRQAVADYVSRRFGVEVDPDTQVMPTSGSKEAVFSAPLAFVDRDAGDVVVYGTPGYPIYQRGALFAGAETHEVRPRRRLRPPPRRRPRTDLGAGGDRVDLHPAQPDRRGHR